MPKPWEAYQQQGASPAKPWEKYGGETPPAPPVWSGTIMPFSKDAEGNVSFDSNAGVVGMAKDLWRGAKDAAMLPGDVVAGKVPMYGEDGRTSDELIQRSAGAAAFSSPVNPAFRSGDFAVPVGEQLAAGRGYSYNPATRLKKDAPVPTHQELLETGGKEIDDAVNMGVEYNVGAFSQRMSEARARLEASGLNVISAPKTAKVLKRLENPPADSQFDLLDLHGARRTLQEIAGSSKRKSERRAATQLVAILDEFVEKAGPESVVAGPASTAAEVFKAGRANYAAGSRSQGLNRKLDAADLQAATANSGQNAENNIRRKAARIVDPEHPERAAGFNKGELALIRGVAEGKHRGAGTLRFVGNLLGGGGGLGMLASSAVGATAGSALGPFGTAAGTALLPGAGYLLKSSATKGTRKAFNSADEAVRKRSPLYEERMRNAPATAVHPIEQELLLRAMMAQEQGRGR